MVHGRAQGQKSDDWAVCSLWEDGVASCLGIKYRRFVSHNVSAATMAASSPLCLKMALVPTTTGSLDVHAHIFATTQGFAAPVRKPP